MALKQSNRWLIAVGILAVTATVTVVYAVSLYISTPQCPPGESAGVVQLTFDSMSGKVTFTLSSEAFTLVKVKVEGAGIPAGGAVVTLNSGRGIMIEGTLTLTVTFSGVTFQPEKPYGFTFTSACRTNVPFTIYTP